MTLQMGLCPNPNLPRRNHLWFVFPLPPRSCTSCLSQQELWKTPLISTHSCLQPGHLFQERRASDAGGVESFADVSDFFLSTHQMKQIRPCVWEEKAENGLAGVTLSNNSPALLYIHQSAVSYLGQLYTGVFWGPRGTRRLDTKHFCPLSLMQAHFLRNDSIWTLMSCSKSCFTHGVRRYVTLLFPVTEFNFIPLKMFI